jgi:hypothetical protein
MSSQNKCAYCGTRGHKITACEHPFAINLWETFQNKLHGEYALSQHNVADRAHYVFEYLKTLPVNSLKLLAVKHNIRLCKHTKLVLISKIMDVYFEDHPFPVWRDCLDRQRELRTMQNEIRIETEQLRLSIALYHAVLPERFHSVIDNRRIYSMTIGQLRSYLSLLTCLVERLELQSPNNPEVIDRKFPIQMTCKPIPEDADQYEVDECSICYENVTGHHMVHLNCSHGFCEECVTKTLKSVRPRQMPTCALCRTEVTSFETHEATISKKLESFIR